MCKIASLKDLTGLDHSMSGHCEALQMNMHPLEIINDHLQQSPQGKGSAFSGHLPIEAP